ncbi:MAG: MerR family transcriptional regulator [Planctomycetota bacterium]
MPANAQPAAELSESPALRLVSPDPQVFSMDEARASFLSAPPPKLYKAGELAAFTGLTRQTIHNYTRLGLIGEAGWTAGGHRVYPASAFARLRRIIELRRTRTMAEIRDILDRELGPSPAA